MNKINKHLVFIAFLVIIVLVSTSCASILYSVHIRSHSNLSSVLAGGTLNLGATGRNIKWTVSSTSDGSGAVTEGTFITANGVLTIAANETASVIYIKATSLQDGFSDIKLIRIVTVSGVTVAPTGQPVVVGRTLQLSAQVSGTNNPDNAVTWRVSSNTVGTGPVASGTNINANGLLSAGATETASVLYIFAISVVDPTKFTSIPIGVVIPVVTGVSISPINQSATIGSTLQFNSSVTGTNYPSNAVTWRVSSNAAGTGAVTSGTSINTNGLLTIAANETSQVLYIFATSVANPSIFSNTYVTIIVPVANPAVNNPSTTNPSTTNPGTASPNVTSPNTSKPVVTNPGASKPAVTTPSVTNPVVSSPTVTAIAVNPLTYATKTNSTVQLSASVTGTNNPNTAVSWKVSSNAAGTGAVAPGTGISSSGLLTVAPNEWATTLYVFATSVADPTKSGLATVTITNNNEKQGGNQGKAQGKN